MPIKKWDPFSDLIAFHQEMFGEGSELGLTDAAKSTWSPPVDIFETPAAFILRAEVPGVAPDQIKIEYQYRRITLSGEKPAQKEQARTYHWLERSQGRFERTFLLPEYICCDDIEAQYQDGVLEIVIPKKPDFQPQTIKVQA